MDCVLFKMSEHLNILYESNPAFGIPRVMLKILSMLPVTMIICLCDDFISLIAENCYCRISPYWAGWFMFTLLLYVTDVYHGDTIINHINYDLCSFTKFDPLSTFKSSLRISVSYNFGLFDIRKLLKNLFTILF